MHNYILSRAVIENAPLSLAGLISLKIVYQS